MDRERPRGREKNVTGQGTGLGRRGNGLGTGPVGSQDGYSGKGSGSGGGGRRITRGAGLSLPVIILAIIVYMLGGSPCEAATGVNGLSDQLIVELLAVEVGLCHLDSDWIAQAILPLFTTADDAIVLLVELVIVVV